MLKGKKYTAEQIVTKLREAEVLLGKGMSLGEVCRQLEITDVTYYRWRKEYGGLRVDQAKHLKELENSRLKKAVADLTLDTMIRKEVNRKNFSARLRSAGRSTGCGKSSPCLNGVPVGCWISHARPSGRSRGCVRTKRNCGRGLLAWRVRMAGTDTVESQDCSGTMVGK